MSEFYSGKFLINTGSDIDPEAYCLPDTDHEGNFLPGSFTDTSNVEELLADPEEFNLFPLEVQGGCDEYAVTFSVGEGDFSQDQFEDLLFYPGFYLGPVGVGRKPQTTPIALGDFYTVPIESGSPSGSREILEFC